MNNLTYNKRKITDLVYSELVRVVQLMKTHEDKTNAPIFK